MCHSVIDNNTFRLSYIKNATYYFPCLSILIFSKIWSCAHATGHHCNTPDHQLPTGCQSYSSPAIVCRLCVCWEWLSDLQMDESGAPLVHFPNLSPTGALWDASVVLSVGEDALHDRSQHTLPACKQRQTCYFNKCSVMQFLYHILIMVYIIYISGVCKFWTFIQC